MNAQLYIGIHIMYIELLNYHNITQNFEPETNCMYLPLFLLSHWSPVLPLSVELCQLFSITTCKHRQSCVIVLKICLVYYNIWHFGILGFKFYHPTWIYGPIWNVQANSLACHILVSVCLLGSNLNTCAKPEKIRPSRDTTGI